jgi:hypothetical protein
VKITRSYLMAAMIVLLVATGLLPACSQSQSFQDDFNDPKSGWFIYKPDDTKGGKYDTGAYSLWTNTKTTLIALNPKTRQDIRDFTVEANVKKVSGEIGTALGIVYRMDIVGHYRFTITDNQTFWIAYSKGTQLEMDLVEEQFSPYIKPASEGNKLKVICTGAKHEVYANDNLLATVTDNTSLKGELGMCFSNWRSPAASYTFSDFKLLTR